MILPNKLLYRLLHLRYSVHLQTPSLLDPSPLSFPFPRLVLVQVGQGFSSLFDYTDPIWLVPVIIVSRLFGLSSWNVIKSGLYKCGNWYRIYLHHSSHI